MTKSISVPTEQFGNSEFAISAFRRYAGELRRYLDRRLSDAQDREDLAQEVYLRLLRRRSDAPISSPLGLLYAVAAGVLADHVSARRRERERFPSAGEFSEVALDEISEALAHRLEEHVDVQQRLEQALALLPPMHAAVLVLHERDGMTREEVAARLNLSAHTVKKYIVEGNAIIRNKAWK